MPFRVFGVFRGYATVDFDPDSDPDPDLDETMKP